MTLLSSFSKWLFSNIFCIHAIYSMFMSQIIYSNKKMHRYIICIDDFVFPFIEKSGKISENSCQYYRLTLHICTTAGHYICYSILTVNMNLGWTKHFIDQLDRLNYKLLYRFTGRDRKYPLSVFTLSDVITSFHGSRLIV